MKKHRFNWVDGLVLALILLLVAGTCLKFLVLDKTQKTRDIEKIQFTLEISGIRNYSVENIQVGDAIYDNNGKGQVGVISNIEVTPAKAEIYYSDGTLGEGLVEDRYDLKITVDTEGTVSEDGYQVDAYKLVVNTSSTYFTKYSIWSALITSVRTV